MSCYFKAYFQCLPDAIIILHSFYPQTTHSLNTEVRFCSREKSQACVLSLSKLICANPLWCQQERPVTVRGCQSTENWETFWVLEEFLGEKCWSFAETQNASRNEWAGCVKKGLFQGSSMPSSKLNFKLISAKSSPLCQTCFILFKKRLLHALLFQVWLYLNDSDLAEMRPIAFFCFHTVVLYCTLWFEEALELVVYSIVNYCLTTFACLTTSGCMLTHWPTSPFF